MIKASCKNDRAVLANAKRTKDEQENNSKRLLATKIRLIMLKSKTNRFRPAQPAVILKLCNQARLSVNDPVAVNNSFPS